MYHCTIVERSLYKLCTGAMLAHSDKVIYVLYLMYIELRTVLFGLFSATTWWNHHCFLPPLKFTQNIDIPFNLHTVHSKSSGRHISSISFSFLILMLVTKQSPPSTRNDDEVDLLPHLRRGRSETVFLTRNYWCSSESYPLRKDR